MGRGRFFVACSDWCFVRSYMRWVAAGSSWHAATCGFARTYMRWVAAGGTNDDDDDDDDDENEKHGIPDNPPQQRTQGTNTPFGQTPHSDNAEMGLELEHSASVVTSLCRSSPKLSAWSCFNF